MSDAAAPRRRLRDMNPHKQEEDRRGKLRDRSHALLYDELERELDRLAEHHDTNEFLAVDRVRELCLALSLSEYVMEIAVNARHY